jgi:muramidase (phage lysozyme)
MPTQTQPLDALAYAFLDAIAIGENTNPTEYNELVGGGNFSSYDTFPEWNGRRFKTGTSHAAGRYQFQPATWASVAKSAGLDDFTPDSQDKAAWWLAQADYRRRTGRDLRTDLAASRFDRLVSALQPTWASISAATGPRFAGAYTARRMLAS